MTNYRVISSDNHVFEPSDLWTSRARPAFKDRFPQLVREYDGDWWYCDGHRVIGLSPGAQTGMRFEAPEKMVRTTTFDKVRRGGYVPEEHLKDMDADGVDVSIVYPTVGLLLYSVPDSALLSEIFRGYNDWLAEFCSAEPKRLKGIAMINVDDVQEGGSRSSLERCAEMGLAGGMVTVYPPEGRGNVIIPCMSPCGRRPRIWTFPLACISRPTGRVQGRIFRSRTATASATPSWPTPTHWVRMSLADMIFSGVFERYPKLHGGHRGARTDPGFPTSWTASTTPTPNGSSKSAIGLRRPRCPATISTATCLRASRKMPWVYATVPHYRCRQSPLGLRFIPMSSSTFPRSRQIIEDVLEGLYSEEEKATRSPGGNAARIYRLN